MVPSYLGFLRVGQRRRTEHGEEAERPYDFSHPSVQHQSHPPLWLRLRQVVQARAWALLIRPLAPGEQASERRVFSTPGGGGGSARLNAAAHAAVYTDESLTALGLSLTLTHRLQCRVCEIAWGYGQI